VQSASGMDQVDRSAMAAVEDAGPFEPLPAHAPKLLNIRFTFDYQASVLPKEDMRVLRPPSLAR
jgi:outer membrane biosynthesis protein TonB